ncbi:MAG TPA: glycosyl transferase family protein [Allosphingosinicella sp.]|jgi:adsorption protein B|nr:glycosyl transferase family protein [Allosphingosinicella sp.]
MDVWGPLVGGADFIMRETALFAATGFLVLGVGDLAVDLLWLGHRARRLGRPAPRVADLPAPARPGRLAVFVPAWDEAAVIGDMLRGAAAAWPGGDWRIYVGTYGNDRATAAAAAEAASAEPRIRVVTATEPGPTTKADCLNRLWLALLADEAAEGGRAKAVVLHDSEDVVHPAELRLFDVLVERFDLVQLPVVPLIDPSSRWIGAHYADEFLQSHGKEMVVRGALGAGLPSAGVGCAFSREALGRLAADRGGLPFDSDSLTEDYELGLRLAEAGGRRAFVRRLGDDGEIVATRGYFPGTLAAAVRQKARWMTGIALSGWDRLGWSGGLAERWMRFRDRQSLLAAVLLAAGYASLALWLALEAWRAAGGDGAEPLPAALSALLGVNFALLGWRLAVRAAFTGAAYGWSEGLRAVPRAAVANFIALLAAASALSRYRALRRGGRPRWDKTAHIFPVRRAQQ